MCLYSTSVTPLIAEEDITVYKLLYNKEGTLLLYAPFYGFKYTPNKLYINNDTPDIEKYDDDETVAFHHIRRKIGKGFFHAYINRDIAKRQLYRDYKHINTILKATIPKGSKYFLGIDDDICSNQIIINL
jgi:hypothetical protein